ncbi:MAG: tRNA uridine-5-carboxymethylaminomethyl(34) synthesis GTPase MnmE [Halocynthiibacter sp.]
MDTIFALATARGKAGVAVVRISGPQAGAAARVFAGDLPASHRASLRQLKARDGQPLDQALVLYFPQRHSFTGESVVEFHLHGSPATVAAVLRELSEQPGLRLAEPGEFTRQAFENERLDLAQVEGLADLIDSETEAQRKQALRVLSGALGALAEGWRSALIRAAALLEATIDFADEDVPVDVAPEVLDLIGAVQSELAREISGSAVSERIRDGFEVAIVGAPNVGKSTLLNALAGREAAITSEFAGTTRDVIEVRMDLHGLAVTILDTAGLRDTNDALEGIGIARAVARANASDLRVFLCIGDEKMPGIDYQEGDIVVQGKGDLGGSDGFAVSGKTGAGVGALISHITGALDARAASASVATRERHRVSMISAQRALDSARDEVLNSPERSEIAAEELRIAIRALDSLIGRVDVENILDEIFASFCLGK